MVHGVDLEWLTAGGPGASGCGAAVPVRVDPATVLAFERVCRRRGVSLFSGSAAMFSVLLHAGSGQRTIPLITPVDSRGTDGAGLVGCFVNNVVLRIEVDPALAVDELIRQVGNEMANALANHATPFGRVVAEAAGRRTDLEQPLSNVALVHDNAPTGVAIWGGLTVRRQRLCPYPRSATTLRLPSGERRPGCAAIWNSLSISATVRCRPSPMTCRG